VVSTEQATSDGLFLTAIDRAAQGTLDLDALLFEADRLSKVGQTEKLSELYRVWLSATKSPAAYAIWFNFGVVLAERGDAGAEEAYRTAFALRPDFIPARLNLGTHLERVGRTQEALDTWSDILKLDVVDLRNAPDYHVQALNNLGRLLEIKKRFDEAEAALAESLILSPDQPDARQHWIHLRQKQCKWPVNAGPLAMSQERFQHSGSALSTLSLFDDPALQLEAGRRFMREKVRQGEKALARSEGYGHERLRIGYLSSDFCLHPVSLLTVELFERHDRERFEIYGFCASPEDGSPLRDRVIKAFDHFVRIKSLTDTDTAALIRHHEIDILIDLQGLTSGVRPNIYSFRPAPVQMTWLGFPGTTGHSEIDYVISDDFVIPPEGEEFFSEKPLRLPFCFQPSDNQRQVGALPTRAECGLPDHAFVYCCFNNNYKITPDLFEAWMRILSRRPGSVLWLLADTVWCEQNFAKEAERLGISRERLIFASRAAPPDYLARYQLADLFLDTYPFNAGTTANDALWMGLPLLTLSGKSFVSRMAGSLLTALNLPDFIATTLADYEEKAVSFGQSRDNMIGVRRELIDGRQTSRLYDMARFAQDVEAAFQSTVSHWPKGEPLRDADLVVASQKVVLNLDVSRKPVASTLSMFHSAAWREMLIGQPVEERFSTLPDGSFDAIFSAHALPRLYAHEVPSMLQHYHRLLTDEGFAIFTCTDLKAIAARIIADQFQVPMYESPAGPITPLDMMFGHRASIADGHVDMAHRTGFTVASLIDALTQAGFSSVRGLARPQEIDLWVVASKRSRSDDEFARLIEEIFTGIPA